MPKLTARHTGDQATKSLKKRSATRTGIPRNYLLLLLTCLGIVACSFRLKLYASVCFLQNLDELEVSTETVVVVPSSSPTLAKSDKELLFCNDEEPTAKVIFKDPSPPSAPLDGCFVSAIFGTAVDTSDKPFDASNWHKNSTNFAFIMFTNLADLPTPGWRKVLYFDSRIKRMITLSRYPKFLAWKHDWIQKNCPVVFYMDGVAVLDANAQVYRDQAPAILHAEAGIAQSKHYWNLRREIETIPRLGKDLQANVDTSRMWLEAQPDFSWDAQLYINTYFGTRKK